MAEYKDAQAVITEITKVCDDCWHIQRIGGCPRDCFIKYAVKAVESVPAADVVPVVRCADCIQFRPDDDVWGWCTVSGKMRCKDYCSYGLRKDDDYEQTKKPE